MQIEDGIIRGGTTDHTDDLTSPHHKSHAAIALDDRFADDSHGNFLLNAK
jgi:hypothetical protein